MQRIIAHAKAGLAITAIACIAAFSTPPSNAGSPVAPADAAATYKSKCAGCHGADGSGQTKVGKAMKLRDLRSAEVQGQTDDQLIAITSKGKGKMPPYGKALGADKCKQLVAYIRTLKK